MEERNNVVGLNVKNVYSDIVIFLEEEYDNEKTRKAYAKDIEIFFGYMRGKQINELTPEDIQFEYSDVLKYRSYLKNKITNGKKASASTVNRRISTMRALYKFFKKNKYDVDPIIFEVKQVKSRNPKSWGEITLKEAQKMVEAAKELPNGEEKSLCLELLYKTSIRVDFICNLKWNDFKWNAREDVWLIDIISKKDTEECKPISKEMYEKLSALKSKDADYTDKVFSIGVRTIQRAFDTLCEKLDLDKQGRSLTVHSFKSTLVNWEIDENDDVIAANKQAGHSNMDTTFKHYVKRKENYSEYAGIAIEKDVKKDEFEDFSKDELLAAVDGMNSKIKLKLIKELQKNRGND